MPVELSLESLWLTGQTCITPVITSRNLCFPQRQSVLTSPLLALRLNFAGVEHEMLQNQRSPSLQRRYCSLLGALWHLNIWSLVYVDSPVIAC